MPPSLSPPNLHSQLTILMKAKVSALLLLTTGLLLVGNVHAAALTAGATTRALAAPSSLTGAVIRLDDGTVISVKSSDSAVVNDCDTAEFAYRVEGKSIYIKSMHVVDAGRKSYCYQLTGDVTCASPARIVVTAREGKVLKGVIMGYFGHDYCGDLSADDCLKGVPVTITLP